MKLVSGYTLKSYRLEHDFPIKTAKNRGISRFETTKEMETIYVRGFKDFNLQKSRIESPKNREIAIMVSN
jgi:hypothetical protein